MFPNKQSLLIAFSILFVGGVWLARLWSSNWLLALVVFIVSYLLVVKLNSQARTNNLLLVVLFVLVLVFQYQKTNKVPLTEIKNDDRRLIDLRLKQYPVSFLKVGNWLEQRKEIIVLRRIEQNVFENLDPNQYFFAGHPSERVGLVEIEKFPYVWLVFFVYGIYLLVTTKKLTTIAPFFIIPVMLMAFIGNQTSLGPFCLFPFFSATIVLAVNKVFTVFRKKPWRIKGLIIFIFFIVYCQIIIYAFN